MILILANEDRSPIFCNVMFALNGVVSESKVPSFNHILPLGSLKVFEIFNLPQPPYPHKGICRYKRCRFFLFNFIMKTIRMIILNVIYMHHFVLLGIAALFYIMFNNNFPNYWAYSIWIEHDCKCLNFLALHCQYHACIDGLSIAEKLQYNSH